MDLRHEDGIAMIMAMAATLLMSALGMALVLTTSSETLISSNFRAVSARFMPRIEPFKKMFSRPLSSG